MAYVSIEELLKKFTKKGRVARMKGARKRCHSKHHRSFYLAPDGNFYSDSYLRPRLVKIGKVWIANDYCPVSDLGYFKRYRKHKQFSLKYSDHRYTFSSYYIKSLSPSRKITEAKIRMAVKREKEAQEKRLIEIREQVAALVNERHQRTRRLTKLVRTQKFLEKRYEDCYQLRLKNSKLYNDNL